MTEDRNIDTYRVGWLYALRFDWRTVLLAHRKPTKLTHELKYVLYQARKGNWRAVRMTFGGWHAEHRYAGTRVGKGWTRNRALADLRRHLDQLDAARTATPNRLTAEEHDRG